MMEAGIVSETLDCNSKQTRMIAEDFIAFSRRESFESFEISGSHSGEYEDGCFMIFLRRVV
jgi:hypothetical protein